MPYFKEKDENGNVGSWIEILGGGGIMGKMGRRFYVSFSARVLIDILFPHSHAHAA